MANPKRIVNFPILPAAIFAVIALATSGCFFLPIAKRGDQAAGSGAEEVVTPSPSSPARTSNASSPAQRSSPAAPRQTPARPTAEQQGLRLPDMTGLPTERDLTRPSGDDDSTESEGIRARPPTD